MSEHDKLSESNVSPAGHSHANEPSLLTQEAFSPHGEELHSLMSMHLSPLRAKPDIQTHKNDPTVFSHLALS